MKLPYTGYEQCGQHVGPLFLSFHQVLCAVSSHSQHPLNIFKPKRKPLSKCVSSINLFNNLFIMHFWHFKVYSHLIMEQSLAAEKRYLSSEVMTRQVIGSLCPLNSLMSDASGGKSWREKKCVQKQFSTKIKHLANIRENLHLHLWQ